MPRSPRRARAQSPRSPPPVLLRASREWQVHLPSGRGAGRRLPDSPGQGEWRHMGSPLDYAGLGLAALAGWIGVPGLGEGALIAAGVYAARGRLDITEVVVVACIGATIGGMAGWLLGLKLGRSVFAGPGPFLRARGRVLD